MIFTSIGKRVFLISLLFTILFLGHDAIGQITTLNTWANQYHGTAMTTQNVAYAIPAGSNSNRILVVAIASSQTGVGTRTVVLTYGGQALTASGGDMTLATVRQHTQFYYLNEAGLDAAVGTTLSFSVSGGTTRITDVFAAVFDGVNQTSPITNSQNYSSADVDTTNPVFATPLNVNANGLAIEIISSFNTAGTAIANITYATNWTMTTQQTNAATNGVRNAVATRSVPTSSTTDVSSTTFSLNSRGSMTGISLNAYVPVAWYSYQSGNFNNSNTWTLDPSGTTYDNGLGQFPAYNDEIHILNGFTVTFNLNSRTLSATEIKSGGVLDMATSTSNNLGVITGTGLLKVQNGGTSFPTGTYTDFVSTTGGTIEYYNLGGTFSTVQTTYNNLRLTNSTGNITYILDGNLTVNGTFDVGSTGAGTVTWQINGTGANQRTIILNEDLTVGTNGRITAGSGNPGSPHSLTIYGNLTNSGVVRFGDPNNVPFNSNPATAAVLRAAATGRGVNVTFTGTTDQIVTCNGQTDFYRFIVNKGTTQTPMVTVNSSATANFRLFGSANLSAGGASAAIILNNALAIANGTLHLTGAISIPSLIENNAATDTYDFYGLPNTAGLWLDGSGVSVTVTQNLSTNDDQRLIVNGLLKVSNGTFTGGHSKGLGTTAGGTVIVEGGIVNAWQYRVVAGVGTVTVSSAITYTQTGGKVYLGTTGYNNGTETLPAITGITAGAFDQYARFSLGDPTSVFNMSGGDLHIGPPTAYNIAASNAGGLDIQGSSTVTGGTVHMYIPNGAHNTTTPSGNGTNAKHFSIYSTAPLYDVNIYRLGTTGTVGTTACIATLMSSLTVLNNLTLVGTNNPALYCDGYDNSAITTGPGTAAPTNNNLTVGGNLIIQSGARFVPSSGTGVLTFNGSGAQSWTNSGTILTVIPAVVVSKAGTLTVTNALGQNITNLTLTTGTLADNNNTLTVTGTLTNNATHTSTGTGSITYSGTNAIGGNNGTFGNLFITTAGTSTVATSGNQTVTGTLRLVNNTTLNIGNNALTVLGKIYANANPGTAGAFTDFTATKRILTSGFHNAGGLTRSGIAREVSGELVFPVGTGTLYTPNVITVTASTHGTITVRPVSSGHPNATTTNESLQYYWRVTSSDYAGITAVSHTNYTYTAALLAGGNTGSYRAARFDPSNFTWGTCSNTAGPPVIPFNAAARTTIPDFNTNTGWAGVTGTKLDGEYTCGFQTAFGAVTPYYSKDNGNWNAASGVWTSNSDHVTGNIAGPPCSYCPVIIGNGTSIFHKIDINATGQGCGTLSLNVGSTLDCGTFTGLDLGTNTTGTGTLRIASATFPSGDFINFLGAGGGTVDWYGATKTIPIATTGLTGSIVTTGTGAITGMTAGIYQNVTATTSGSGTGALFTVVITNATTIGSITVSQSGTGYVAPNTLTFSGTSFGVGGGGSRTVTLAADDIVTTTLTSYYKLIVNPNGAATITLPATNLNIYNNLTQGDATFGTYTGTVLTNGARTISVGGNMNISAGSFTFSINNDANAGGLTTMSVTGNTTISTGAFFGLATTGTVPTARLNTFSTSGGITNNGTMSFRNTGTVDITFTGSGNVNFDGTGSVAAAPNGTTLNLITVNKATSQTPTVTFSVGGRVNTTAVTGGWLKLINGTFDFNNPAAATFNAAANPSSTDLSTDSYTIPSSARLRVSGVNVTVNTTSTLADANDLFLNGALEIAGGTVNVGSTAGTTNNVDIEYAATGTPTIGISSGTLWVRSSVRRSTTVLTGALNYNQTGGTVTAGGIASSTARGVFEIDHNTGSSFTLTNGTLNVQRQTGGTGYADVYINPVSSNVLQTSTIAVGLGTNPSTTQNNLRVYIVPVIGNFNVQNGNGTNAQTVVLYNDLAVGGKLTIPTPSVLNAATPDPDANVTIGGDFDCTGIYTSGTNTTTFNGASAQSAVLTSTTDFYNVTVNKPSGILTVSGIAPAAPGLNNLSILSGTLEVGKSLNPLSSTLKVNRDIIINGTQSGTQAVEVYTTTGISNTITSSGGSFTNLTLGGSDATSRTVNQSGNLSITGLLTFNTNRYLMIAANQLTFGGTASVSGASTTSFIRTNGVSNDLGVTKTWTGNGTFIYPVGTSSNYTPVSYTLNVTQAGTLTVVPVNSAHLTYNQESPQQILKYYWSVRRGSTLTATASGNPYVSFTYYASMFDGVGGTLVAAYFDPTSNPLGWAHSPANGGAANTTLMTFNSTPTTNLPPAGSYYDYSVGTAVNPNATLPNPILPLYSRLAGTNVTNLNVGGNWTVASNWTADSDGDPNGDNPSLIVPTGVPAVILSGARINTASDGRRVFRITINGLLSNGTTAGHNFGTISGTGTFRTATNTFPAGDYTAFVSSAGGTVEYIAPMTMSSMTTYNNLSIYSGTPGIVSKSASNLLIHGDVTIPVGTTLDNSANNASLSIEGDWINNGTIIHGSGTATITFSGSAPQSVTGTNSFNNLTMNSSSIVTLNGTTTVNGALTLTSGNIISNSFPTTPLLRLGSAATVSGGSASSFVSGQIRKSIDVATTTAFTFPTGSNSPSRYRPVGISNTSASGDWDVSYIPNNPTTDLFPNKTFNSANIVEVSEHEYWQVARTGAATAALTLSFGPGSYASGGNAGILSSLRIARWTGSQWDLPPGTGGVIGAGTFSQTGDNLSGTVSFSAQSSFSPQTLASLDINSALPIELVSFRGKVAGDVVQLIWETASELNNDFFTVERSTGGEVFSSIGQVNGAGTTNQGKTYSLIDHNPIYGTAYYRLKQTDFDGTFTYSKIIPITCEGATFPVMDVYPNPSGGDQLNIKISGIKDIESVPVVMYDQLGRECMRLLLMVDQSSGTAYKSFTPQEPLPKGIYVLKAGASPMLMKRFVVTSK